MTMATYKQSKNPYYHRGPIKDPDQFFGRGHELASIFQRIEKGECTSLVGERRIGRTSLLRQVMNENVQAKYMGKDHGRPFVYIDCQLGVQTPEGFFYEVFRAVKELDVSFSFEAGDRIGYKRQVRNCLEKIGAKGHGQQGLVLLLDEFEYIAGGSGFPLDFFSFLRGMAPNYDVCFVVATQTELHECCHPQVVGSPFFNIFVPLYLGSFTEEEFDYFLAETSNRSGVSIYNHKGSIYDLAGRFPFFIQVACYYCFEAWTSGGLPLDHAAIQQQFLDEARGHFMYILSHLDDSERDLVVALAEGEQIPEDKLWSLTRKGYVVDGNLFSSAFAEFVIQIERDGPVPKQGVFVDEQSGDVWVRGNLLEPPLAELEYRLLAYLYKKCNQICSRYNIVLAVWGEEYIEKVDDARIDQLVRRVRLRIEPDPAHPRYIETVRGRGYRFRSQSGVPPARRLRAAPALEWATVGYALAFSFFLLAGFLSVPWSTVGYAVSILLALMASLLLVYYMIFRSLSSRGRTQ